MALELSRIYQRINPLDSWAYAIEAKYAPTAKERIKPLGIALYLDERSYHLAEIPEQEKKNARKWFAENNPFRLEKKQTIKNQT
jgi:hypothetical protein